MDEPRLFTIHRHVDETGLSGTGRIIDGVVFHTGQVVICWRSDIRAENPGHTSIGIYPTWEAFLAIHVHPHGSEAVEIRNLGGEDRRSESVA